MIKVDISIWGIRAGFEENGIFHSHNFEDVKLLQRDRLRSLADVMRPRNFFILNRTNQHSVVTLVYTDIFESAVSGNPRSGHVGFSLIFPKNQALVDSPRKFLLEFAKWYKQIQGNSRINNFTANQITEILNNLTLKEINIKDRQGEMVVAINSENELDDFLAGGNKYAAFKELIFIESNVNFSQTGLTNQMISIEKSKEIVDNEEQKEFERKEAQRLQLKQINEAEREIQELKHLNRIDELINKYDKFPYRDEFSNTVKNIVQTEKQKIALKNLNQEDEKRAVTIRELIENRNLEVALAHLSKLKDKNRLSQKERNMLEQYELKVNQEKLIRKKERENKKKSEDRKKIILFSGVGVLLISLATLSYMFKFPEFLFEEPQIASKKTSNQSDIVNTNETVVLDTFKIIYKKQSDSLVKGNSVQLIRDIVKNDFLKKGTWIKYFSNPPKWQFKPKEDTTNIFLDVKASGSKDSLSKMFNLTPVVVKPGIHTKDKKNDNANSTVIKKKGGNSNQDESKHKPKDHPAVSL
jgi:hypothetical protein